MSSGYSLHYCEECGEQISPTDLESDGRFCWRCGHDANPSVDEDRVRELVEESRPVQAPTRAYLPKFTGRRPMRHGFCG